MLGLHVPYMQTLQLRAYRNIEIEVGSQVIDRCVLSLLVAISRVHFVCPNAKQLFGKGGFCLIKEFGLHDKFSVLSKHDIAAFSLIRDTPADTQRPMTNCEIDLNAATAMLKDDRGPQRVISALRITCIRIY